MKLPADTPVIVTEHVPADRVQLEETVPMVLSEEDKATVPVGVLAALVVSATVTLHEPVAPTLTEAAHEIVVDVESSV